MSLPQKNRTRKAAVLVAITLSIGAALGTGPATASAKSPCGKWGNTLPTKLTAHQAQLSVRCLLNKQRQRHGLKKLKLHKRLNKAAGKHSRVMKRKSCFDHVCPGEASLESRLSSVRYLLNNLLQWSYGENIGWGQAQLATPRAMVKAWMHSPPHRANILDGGFRDLGVGFSRGNPYSKKGKGGLYTTDFGRRVK